MLRLRVTPTALRPSSPKASARPGLVVLASALLLAPTLAATRGTATVPPEALARRAPIVLTGVVDSVRSGRSRADGAIATYVEIGVERVLRGPELDRVTLREPGGRWGAWQHRVLDAPRYTPGERVWVYLVEDASGLLRTFHRSSGKLTVEVDPDDGEVTAWRDEPHGRVAYPVDELLDAVRQPTDVEPPGPFETRARGVDWAEVGPADFELPTLPYRWQEADADQALTVDVDRTGEPLGDPEAAVAAVSVALGAWNDVREARVELALGEDDSDYLEQHALDGSPALFVPSFLPTGSTVVLFDDPFGDLDAPIDCVGSPVTAGAWAFTPAETTVNGVDFTTALYGYVILADGWNEPECDLLGETSGLEEVLAHGFGRVLGLTTSAAEDSIMTATPSGDRGARLGDDDVAGLQCIYPHALELLAPVGGEVLVGGADATLDWSSTADADGPGTVDLQISYDSGQSWLDVVAGAPNLGTHPWSVPNVDTATARVRVYRPLAVTPPAPFPSICALSESASDFAITFVDAAPGETPDGATLPGDPLELHTEGDAVRLTWGSSCGPAVDYGIYQGTLAALRAGQPDHTAVSCADNSGRSRALPLPAEASYYLIAPIGAAGEGLYGRGSDGIERDRGVETCSVLQETETCP